MRQLLLRSDDRKMSSCISQSLRRAWTLCSRALALGEVGGPGPDLGSGLAREPSAQLGMGGPAQVLEGG